jgi:hypothetical protein
MSLALIMALVCWGEVGWGVSYTASTTWHDTSLMICAYLAQVPMVALGAFWTLTAIVRAVDRPDAGTRP